MAGKRKPDSNPSGMIDLDVVVVGTIPLKLRGVVYNLPDQVPLDVAMETMKIQDEFANLGEGETGVETLDRMFSCISQVFRFNPENADMTPEKLKSLLTLPQAKLLMEKFIERFIQQQEEAGNP